MRHMWRMALVCTASLTATPSLAATWVTDWTPSADGALQVISAGVRSAPLSAPYTAIDALGLIAIAILVALRMRPRGFGKR